MSANRITVNIEAFSNWMNNERNTKTLRRRCNKTSHTFTFNEFSSNENEEGDDMFIFNPSESVVFTFMTENEFNMLIKKHTL